MVLSDYRTLVFDCDGVLLDSNRIKTEAFRKVAEPIDSALAEELVRYHVEHGGISRYRKFEFFLERCTERNITAPSNQELCRRFGEHVRDRLLECPVADRLAELRAATSASTWMVASGADEAELRAIFDARDLSPLFDGGIYGSPATKRDIVLHAFGQDGQSVPGLMLGDSREDYFAASGAGLDFVFISAWSEFDDLHPFAAAHGVPVVETPADLLPVED